ncbi:hypothetical protein ACFCW2_09240 [Qipengyuania sp. DSG2-2]|uniref:hypothetical protein n=1 Tax=Qipengyuania sp. DGS2-2 TaxID=3349631 RepID=UPI0036D2FD76
MDFVKAALGLIATAFIAGWVAYSVSAPRNVENAMNQPMAALDGNSINEEMKETADRVRADQCARFTALANEAWDRSLEQGTTDRDQIKLDDLDRQKATYCAN